MGTLVGEVQEHRDGHWRTVRLGETVRVNDRRRVHADPLGLSPQQRAASDRATMFAAMNTRLDRAFVETVAWR